MNTWIIVPLASLVCYTVLLGVNFWFGQRSRVNTSFNFFLISMIVWSLCSFFAHLDHPPLNTLLWNRLMIIGSSGMPLAFFIFVQYFVGIQRTRWTVFGVIVYLAIQAANLSGLVVQSAYVYEGRLINSYGPGVVLPSLAWVLFIGLSTWGLITAYRGTKDLTFRNRIKYLLAVIIVIFAGSVTNATPRLGVYPIDIAFNIVSALVTSYAIFRFHLLDMSVVLRKSLLYSIPTVVLGVVYFFLFSLLFHYLKNSNDITIILLSLVVATLGVLVVQPMRDRAQLWLDQALFREKYDLGMMLQRISQTAASVLDINDLTRMILAEVTGRFHLVNSAIFLKKAGSDNFRLSAQTGLEVDQNLLLRPDHPVVRWLEIHHAVLSRKDIEIHPQFLSLLGQERQDLEQLKAELFVPIQEKGTLIGILLVGVKRSEETFSTEDQATLDALANQTAVALENARLFAEAKERTVEMQFLNTAIQAELAERQRAEKALKESEQRYRRLAENAPDLIYRMLPDGRFEFIGPAVREILGYVPKDFYRDPALGSQIVFPADRELLAQIVQPGTVEVSSMKEPRVIRWVHKNGTLVWIELHQVPIYSETGQLIAVEGVARDITRRVHDQEELAERVRQLEEHNREIGMLNEMGDVLQACRNREETYPILSAYLQRLFPMVGGVVQVVNPAKHLVETVSAWGDSEISVEVFEPDRCWALRRGRPNLVLDQSPGMLCSHIHYSQVGTHLCLPMMAKGNALGLVTLAFPKSAGRMIEAEQVFSEHQQKLALTVVEHIALALDNLWLGESLRQQAIRDPLTNLFNRRYMEETLERELARSRRKHTSLGIIFADIDHFKRYNDTFGHDAGDQVLRELGLFFTGHIRKEDIACRYGGEEFVLILPESSREAVFQRAEELCLQVKQLDIRFHDQVLGAITFSIGVSIFPDHGATAETLLRCADIALYEAKNAGRDRVRMMDRFETH
ncbi:MAG TPA: diguanylate cyclase [Anaerolineaceae bacterium]|nr:diguanylate cyclase [Anaerolineaceae bacterium]